MNDKEMREVVKRFILETCLPGAAPEELGDTTPLLAGKILDSLTTLRLVSLLEETYAIKFDASEVSSENFDSIAAIGALVRLKVSGAPRLEA
jgi:acyl carrier protein